MAPFSGEEPQACSPVFRPDARAQAREPLAVRVLPKQTHVYARPEEHVSFHLRVPGAGQPSGVGQGLPVGRPGRRLIPACGLPASPLAPGRILVLCFELGS